MVYLTFDDGSSKQTTKILEVLNELEVKASFFLIGSMIENKISDAQAIVAAGNDVGNHSYSHNRMVFKSPSFIKEEIDKTNDLIKVIGYDKEILFRPPFGKQLLFLPMYLNKLNQTTVMWNNEPESYEEVSQSSETIAQYVIDNIHNGSIILLHPMNDKTDKSINAIRRIVTQLKKDGYSFGLLTDR